MEIDKIEKNTKPIDNFIDKSNTVKKNMTRSFADNKGLFVGIILVFIVIVVYTTQIGFDSSLSLVDFGLGVFVLLFCSYAMFINWVDSGIRSGKNNAQFTTVEEKYNTIKRRIVDNKQHTRLAEFCKFYIKDELKTSREILLTEVGISYEEYEKSYLGKDKAFIKKSELSDNQKQAIITANKIKPITLNPNMIIQKARGSIRRKPLGHKPESKRMKAYATKFATNSVTAFFTGSIALETITNPSWSTFAILCLKLFFIVLNGFTGYKMGYENITIYTVNYMNDQIDLMEQFEQYISEHPLKND